MSIVLSYLHYLIHFPMRITGSDSEGNEREVLVLDVSPSLSVYLGTFLWFVSLNLILPKVYAYFNKEVYFTFSPKYKSELSGYLTCICHHIIIAPLGVYFITRDLNTFIEEREISLEDYREIVYASVLTIGYLCGDIVFTALPEMMYRGKLDNLYHHLFTLGLFYCILYQPLSIMKYMPHYFVCEVSPLLYSVSWIIRRQGHEDSISKKGVELAFAGSFFVLRIINMNLVNVVVCKLFNDRMGISGMLFLSSISLLQIFWFSKIVVIAMKGFGTKSKLE